MRKISLRVYVYVYVYVFFQLSNRNFLSPRGHVISSSSGEDIAWFIES